MFERVAHRRVSPMLLYWVIVAGVLIILGLAHVAGIISFDMSLHWSAWVVAGLVLLNGGWMAFDGGRALVVGDYVTPESGPRAGMLGPWSRIAESVGVGARSNLMRWTFLLYGLVYVTVTAAFLLGVSTAWWGILVVAGLGLWYIPFGTLINVIVMILLLLPPLRFPGAG